MNCTKAVGLTFEQKCTFYSDSGGGASLYFLGKCCATIIMWYHITGLVPYSSRSYVRYK